MSNMPPRANSLAEVFLSLLVTPCATCGRGPLQGDAARRVSGEGAELVLAVPVTCAACRAVSAPQFRLPHGIGADKPGSPGCFNPTPEPSTLIDLGQWLTLFRTIVHQAERTTDKQEARRLGLEAAQCLDEALKFYRDPDNDLPDDDAFWCETSRQRFRESPEQFSRKRQLELRARLPSLAAMEAAIQRAQQPPKRKWWRRK
ncbi:MAG TPA: hypothetical protein PKK06_17065 [Phycisphaerae bacterium]|nr:hypothetical protein [Phycisphaerae bacterium]HNU46874.1 hypothetical protein [Phycisphaerae bacterium]